MTDLLEGTKDSNIVVGNNFLRYLSLGKANTEYQILLQENHIHLMEDKET